MMFVLTFLLVAALESAVVHNGEKPETQPEEITEEQ